MKPLYYHEFALSVNDNGENIPAKKFKWIVSNHDKIAYEDINMCQITRLQMQELLTHWVVRIKKANIIKNMCIRLTSNRGINSSNWIIAS